MEYEQLSKSHEYGLSKIYEMVINNSPSVAYLLEGNSIVDQKLVMAHVLGHVDFFKNNFAFSITDQGRDARTGQPVRKWIDTMANHGSIVRRWANRIGIDHVEAFVDSCLSLENLIDPQSPFKPEPERAGPLSHLQKSRGRDRRAASAARREGLHGVLHQPRRVRRGTAQEARRGERARQALPRVAATRRAEVLARARATRALGTRRPERRATRGVLLPAADADEDHERGLGQLLALPFDDRTDLRRVGDRRLRGPERRRARRIGTTS